MQRVTQNQKPKPSFRPIANEQQTSNTRVERLPLKIKIWYFELKLRIIKREEWVKI